MGHMKGAREPNLVQGTAEDIAIKMQTGSLIEDGGHNLLVYDNLDGLRQLFLKYAKAFLPKNEIILLATQYDGIDNIKHFLTEGGIDVTKHLADGTLFIIDAQEGYQGVDVNGTFKLALTLMSRARKEKRRGVTWLGDMGSFFAFDRICELVDYELSCPAKFEDMLKAVCCYHIEDFKNLDEKQQNMLVDHHFKSIFVHNKV